MALLIAPTLPLPELIERLQAALAGRGPALLPVAGDDAGRHVVEAARLSEPMADDTALLLPTSGSTGRPKVVELDREALLASARATHDRVGPPGRWLLSLPLTHVAGWQVLVRGLLAPPGDQLPVPLSGPFTAGAFAETLQANPDVRYVSLVPTQLHRLLDDAHARVMVGKRPQPLTILLGGAPAAAALLDDAREAGLTVVTTYGSTETAGGCVYDGRPLDGVGADVDGSGRLRLTGPTIARGYRGLPDDPAFTTDANGLRRFVTGDLARVAQDGRVEILGRVDDVINTGGEKVHPAEVERLLLQLPGVREVAVVGVADQQWGQRVVAVLAGSADLVACRRHIAERLAPYAAPRTFVLVPALPLSGIGKPDRWAIRALAESAK